LTPAAMREFDLTWVEEPLVPDDVRGHASLQRQSGIPIAAGETLFSIADFQRYFELGAIRYVQADAGRLGGITPWMAVAGLATAHHLPMAPHFLHDLHVHLLCALPNAYRLEFFPLLDATIECPLEISGGLATPSQEHGHGIRLIHDVVRPHLVAESTH
jgi:L-alanine-DL-glutamate epimerase-like enolase superfamily enzyme